MKEMTKKKKNLTTLCHCSQRLIKESCEVMRTGLENDKTVKERTNLNVDIMEVFHEDRTGE